MPDEEGWTIVMSPASPEARVVGCGARGEGMVDVGVFGAVGPGGLAKPLAFSESG